VEAPDAGHVEAAPHETSEEVAGQLAVLTEDDLRPVLYRHVERIARAPAPDRLVARIDREGRIIGVVEHVTLIVADHDEGVRTIGAELLAEDSEGRLGLLDVPLHAARAGQLP